MSIRLDSDPVPLSLGHRRRHVLALSGGGFRGLFTARVLETFEAEARKPCRCAFDLLAGTSIGGIIAIGLAAGIPAGRIRRAIGRLGPFIFRRQQWLGAGWIGARYGQDVLRRAIEAILGRAKECRLADVDCPLLVTTVDQTSGSGRLLLSRGLAGDRASPLSMVDAALATSAAPTYFPPHRYGGRTYVDGGLVANVPDLLAVTEAMRWFGSRLEDLYLVSVGTAGQPADGAKEDVGAPGRLSWLTRHGLFDLIIGAQESLAYSQVQMLLPGRTLRVDCAPAPSIALDAADPQTTWTLLRLAENALRDINRDLWNTFLHHRPDRS